MADEQRHLVERPTETGDADPPEPLPPVARGTGLRTLVITAAAVVGLLVGATAGMLITSVKDDRNASPDAGSVDVAFAQDMTVHHLQAVTLAGWARDHTTDPAIRTLAFAIESAQLEQVGMMEGWLSLWNQPTLPTGPATAWMTGPAAHEHEPPPTGPTIAGGAHLMPGMATQQEIAAMRSLSGRALDVSFLQLMLRHHAGGAPMARYTAEHASTSQVRALAHAILTSQTAEMDTIKAMLADRGAQPLPG